MASHTLYESIQGPLLIGWEEDAVVSIGPYRGGVSCTPPSAPARLAAAQLDEYFLGRRKVFDLPMQLAGTKFQKSVWNAIRQIPYGEVRTYSQIAAAIGNPKAVRAVGQAANRNPLWILIPCHRVVGNGGALTGYAGGLAMKQALLELEQLHNSTPEAR